jgi:diguanylate cyclase (GGDEF)-like protein
MNQDGVVILAILDASLVALFFLFRVLPWSEPGPWRLIWITASLAAMLFSLGELQAMIKGGDAIAFELQGPLFGAILAMTACFILVYMHGARIGSHALELALKDDLTQLPNSRAFSEKVAAQLRRPDAFTLAYVRLDGLGVVNDVLGSSRGDALLKSFADLLRVQSSNGDSVARLAGDRFALILSGDEARAGEVTKKLQESFREMVFHDLAGIDVTTRIGIVSRDQASDPGRLIHLAYRSLQEAR